MESIPQDTKPRKGILSRLWSWLRTYFVVVGIFWTVLPIVVSLTIYSAITRSTGADDDIQVSVGSTKRPNHIEVRIESNLNEQSFFEQAMQTLRFNNRTHLTPSGIRRTLRAGSWDENLKYVDIYFDGGSVPNSQLLRWIPSILKLKEAGKTVRVWARSLSGSTYRFASAANEIVLPEAGGIEVTGPVMTQMYIGPLLDKLGIQFEVIKTGEYKSAFETMTLSKPSAAAEEMLNSLEGSLRSEAIAALVELRGKDSAIVSDWMKRGWFTSTDAMNVGLIDSLGKELAEIEGAVTEQAYEYLHQYVEDLESNHQADDDDSAIGIVRARGEIIDGEIDGFDESDIITLHSLKKKLRWMAEQDDIKTVVLRMDSPGGSALTSDLLWQEVKALNAVKPVVVSMGRVAASGGYYISVAAKEIFAEPTTITGSIGVIAAIPNIAKLGQEYGINFHTVTGSDRGRVYNPSEPLSQDDKRLLTDQIKSVYQLFLNRVAESRTMAVDTVRSLAGGRVYSASEAKQLGLIDQIGTIDDAIRRAKELASLDLNRLYNVKYFDPEGFDIRKCLKSGRDMFRCLNSLQTKVESESLFESLARLDVDALRVRAEGIRRMLSGGGVLAWSLSPSVR